MRDIGKSNLTNLATPAQDKIQGIEHITMSIDELVSKKSVEDKYAAFEERMAKRRERSLEEQAEMKAVRDQDYQFQTRLPVVKSGEKVDLNVGEGVLSFMMDSRNYLGYTDEALANWFMESTEDHPQKKPKLMAAIMFRNATRTLPVVGHLDPSERGDVMWSLISVFMPHLVGPMQILDYGAILDHRRQDQAFPILAKKDADHLKELAIAQVANPSANEASKAVAIPIANGEFPKEWRIRA